MNNYVNESTAVLQFRLGSARSKKRAQHKGRDKQLLALWKETTALSKQRYNLGWIELHPPVVRGWKRYFVLRDDVAKSKQSHFYEGILNKINTTQYSYRKDFKVKKRKWGKKVYVAKEQHLLSPDAFQFNRLKFTEGEKQFFEERTITDKWGRQDKKYIFLEPWRFVLRVRPNIITKTRVRDEVIERRIKEIDNYLERNALWGRIGHLVDGRRFTWHEDPQSRQINPLKNKSFAAILDAFYAKEHDT